MHKHIIILILAISINIFGVTFPEKSKEIKDFVPKNWKILAKETGDLNKDGIEDTVLIIENTNPSISLKNSKTKDEEMQLQTRILLILFKDRNNEYILIEKNDNEFMESENTDDMPSLMDPLMKSNIKIKNNVLMINFDYLMAMGSWETISITYIFRYDGNRFLLIGLDCYIEIRDTHRVHEYSLNFSTQKIKITEDTNKKESKPKVIWKDIKPEKKYYLENMGYREYWELLGL